MVIFPGEPALAGFIGATDDGGGDDNWRYKTCTAPVKSCVEYLVWTSSSLIIVQFYQSNCRCVQKQMKVVTSWKTTY